MVAMHVALLAYTSEHMTHSHLSDILLIDLKSSFSLPLLLAQYCSTDSTTDGPLSTTDGSHGPAYRQLQSATSLPTL
jgi:hypothetical protein